MIQVCLDDRAVLAPLWGIHHIQSGLLPSPWKQESFSDSAETHLSSSVSCDSRPFLSSCPPLPPSGLFSNCQTHTERNPSQGPDLFDLLIYFSSGCFSRLMDRYIFYIKNEPCQMKMETRPEGWGGCLGLWGISEAVWDVKGVIEKLWGCIWTQTPPDAEQESDINHRFLTADQGSFYNRNVGPAGSKSWTNSKYYSFFYEAAGDRVIRS